MREFIAWPFMVMQLAWVVLTLGALLSIVQSTRRPAERRWPWIATGLAGASLQVVGLGLATITASAVVLAALFLLHKRDSPGYARTCLRAAVVLCAAGTLHAVLMLALPRAGTHPVAPGMAPLEFLGGLLGFLPQFLIALAAAVTSGARIQADAALLPHDWPAGVAALAVIGLLLAAAWRRCLSDGSACNQTRFALRTFSLVLFGSLLLLISARQLRQPSTSGFADFLTAPRYLVPASFALAGLAAELLLRIGSRGVPRLIAGIFVALCAVAGQLQFARHRYPQTEPLAVISHDKAWRAVLAVARECRQARLPVPLLPLGSLSQEFHDWDLGHFEPLLRADLHISGEGPVSTTPWANFAAGTPDEYARAVPALAEARRRLRLEPAPR
jgi:hypothetical protein